MPPSTQSRTESWSATLLRRDLSARAQRTRATTTPPRHLPRPQPHHPLRPATNKAATATSTQPPTPPSAPTPPGHAASPNPTPPPAAPEPATTGAGWSSTPAHSSDALLMNIFCHPAVFNGQTLAPAVANLLNIDPATQPHFGINPKVPLKTLRKHRSQKSPTPKSGHKSGCPMSRLWDMGSRTADHDICNR